MADKISEETRKILIAQAALLDNIIQENDTTQKQKYKINARVSPYNPTEKVVSNSEQKKINTIKKLYGF
jgi:hypothetical protein